MNLDRFLSELAHVQSLASMVMNERAEDYLLHDAYM